MKRLIAILILLVSYSVVQSVVPDAPLDKYLLSNKPFELVNKSSEEVKLSIKQKNNLLLAVELPPAKLIQFPLDIKIPTKLFIEYPRKFIEQEFVFSPNKTLYLTLDPLQGKANDLRPQTGTYKGLSGKTASGLSLTYNVKQNEIFPVDQKSITPKFQIENQISNDIIWVALFSRDATNKWNSVGPIRLESNKTKNDQFAFSPHSNNFILYIWENPSAKPVFLSQKLNNPKNVTLPDYIYQFKLSNPNKTVYVNCIGNLVPQAARVVKGKKINSYGLSMDNNITQAEIKNAEEENIDQLDLR